MNHLGTKDRILFLSAVVLGISGGILPFYPLVLASIIILFITLRTSSGFKKHESAFLFPLSLIICLPANLRISILLAETIDFSCFFSVHRLFLFTFSLLGLVSVEELVLGMIGLALWGKQEAIFDEDTSAVIVYHGTDWEETEPDGRYLTEIIQDNPFYPQDDRTPC